MIYKFKFHECEGNQLKDISIFDVQRNFEGKVKKNEGNQILGKSLGLALILIFAIFAEGSQYYK